VLIALIRSVPHAKVESLLITEDGFYELEVHVDMTEALASGAPKEFIKHEIAKHLARCVQDTGLPLKEGLWAVAFTTIAQTQLEFPQGFIA